MNILQRNKWLILTIFILLTWLNQEQKVECRLNLRKFGISFGKDDSSKEIVDESRLADRFHDRLNAFGERIQHDIDEELKRKREKIFREKLLSRVTGAILRDLYSRF
jgi:hypothetical protein